MKKIATILLAALSIYGYSQKLSPKQITNELEKTENSKSGNYKDLFASFFHLAAKNLTGNDKTIELNSTLFQLKANANPDLLQDINFKKEKFSRNLQINFKLNLDDQFKYSGFTGGFTYAIINGRDKQIAVLTNSLYGESHSKMMEIIETIQTELLQELNDSNREEGIEAIEKATESILNGLTDPNNVYYDKIITAFRNKTKENTDFNQKDLNDFILHLQNLKTNEYNKIDTKTLWTIALDGTANKEGKFDRAAIETSFLKGNAAAWNEIDIRAKLSYNDTILLTPLPRAEFKSTAGMNFKLAKSKENISFFEIKAALEYNHIFKNLRGNEKQNYFMGLTEIRIRLADDLWFPIVVKYDIDNANFLGFLNLSYNFGSFQNK